MSYYDYRNRSRWPEVIVLVLFAALMAWKVFRPYTGYGCDGWGEYRRVR